jgi:hypothetical protein
VALHNHQGELLCHLEEESVRVRLWACETCPWFFWNKKTVTSSPEVTQRWKGGVPYMNDRLYYYS